MPRLLGDYEPFSAADRARRYRARKKARGETAPRGKRKSLFEKGEFVAVDGEGFSEGPEIICKVQTSGTEYKGREHFYGFLAASDGSEIYASSGRLSAAQCLDFLLDIKINNPHAILVAFSSSYDVAQMLAYDLPKAELAKLMKGDSLATSKTARATWGEYDYKIEYRPRKALTVWRWKRGNLKYAELPNGKHKLINCDSVTLWDTWGFFQASFLKVLETWVADHPDYPMIADGKAKRAIFARDELEEIRRYNQAELRCLVEVMNRVREAVDNLGLKLTRWDGAGAIASAMMRANGVKEHKEETPAPVFEAARYAYSGGHIEICKIGRYTGPIYHYDVNSAYPAEFCQLPSLKGGKWKRGDDQNPPPGFTLVRVEYHFREGMPFYPLFYREENGRIIYPVRGTGWHWFSEFDVAREFARKFGAAQFRVLEWWNMQPADPTARPFAWIETYYERRKAIIEDAKRRGVPPPGEEKVLKLGYNGCYGKTAQQVGARKGEDGELKAPAFFQMEYAGFVTAGCRAKLMRAAIQHPRAIVQFATDGLFSTRPLTLDCPDEKILGAWEFTKHEGITMVMPGVYWLHDKPTKRNPTGETLHSRGFDKTQMSGASAVMQAWRGRKPRLTVKLRRLIGLGSALTSETFWTMRGMFVETTKELALSGDNSKRYPAMLYKIRPDQGLCDTMPRDHLIDDLAPLSEIHSAIYPLEFADKGFRDDANEWTDIDDARP